MALNNQPATLGKLTAFKENPFPVHITIDDSYTIVEPVNVEIWTDDVLQEDLTVEATVTGQDIDFELSVEQLREVDSSKLFITSGTGESKRYVFGAPLITTMEPFIPTPNTTAYQVNDVGVVQVSVWSDAVNALIATEQANIAAAKATIATTQAGIAAAASADLTTRYGALLDEFGNTLADPTQIDWIGVGGSLVGNTANGGTANTVDRTITIANGSTGVGASLEWSFNYSNLENLAPNDPIKIRLKLSETEFNTIAHDTVVVTMEVSGSPVDITGYSFTPYGESGKVFEVVIPREIDSVTEPVKIKVAIKSGAPVQSPATTITWDSLGYYSDKYLFTQGVNQLAQVSADLYTLFPHMQLPYTYAVMDGGGVTDVSGYLQDYLADASAKSGVIVFKPGNYYIGSKVFINSGLELRGNGAVFIANDSEIFNVKSNDRIWAHHMMIRRNNSSVNATSFKFDSGFTNTDSVFEHIHFLNLPNHLPLDYVKNPKVRYCRFTRGQNGIVAGAVAQDSVTDLEIDRNIFDTVFLIGVSTTGGYNLRLSYNNFGTYDGSAFYGGRCVQISPIAGAHKNIQLIGNNCEAFTAYAVRIGSSGTSTIDGIEIWGGRLRDASTSTTSSPIRINAGSGTTITDLNIENVRIVAKAIGIDLDAITNAQVIANNIRQHTGTFASARGASITNSTYLTGLNTCVGFPGGNPNLFTGSSLLTAF